MKKQAVLLVAVGMLLSACGGAGSSASSDPVESSAPTSQESKPESADTGSKGDSSDAPAPSSGEESEPSSSEEPSSEPSSESSDEDPYDVLNEFLGNLGEARTFTMEDEDWRTCYGYGDDVYYVEYDEESGYAEESSGLVSHPEEGILAYVYDEEGAITPYEVVDADCSYGDSVYDYIYSPMDLVLMGDLVWDAEGDGVFTSEDHDMVGLAAALADYGYSYASYITEVVLTVNEGAEDADLVVTLNDGTNDYVSYINIAVAVEDNPAVTAWRADPKGMPELPEDDGRLAVFLDTLAEGNFVMEDATYRTVYGYGTDALYNEYTEESGYAANSFGLLAHPTQGILEFAYDEDGNVNPTDLIDADGDNVYDYVYSALDLTSWGAEEFEMTGVYEYSLTDSDAQKLASQLAGYGSNLASYVSALTLAIAEDGQSADIVIETSVLGDIEISLTLGDAQSDAIDAWRANPWGIPEPEADDPIALFYDNLAEYKNYTMIREGIRTQYLYNEKAMYNDWEGEYAANTCGYINCPDDGNIYTYTLGEEGEVVTSGDPIATDGSSVVDYFYTVLYLLDVTTASNWSATETEGVYTSTNAYVALCATVFAGYSSNYYSYMKNVSIAVDPDGMHAVLSGTFNSSINVELDITVGNAQSDAVNAYLGLAE